MSTFIAERRPNDYSGHQAASEEGGDPFSSPEGDDSYDFMMTSHLGHSASQPSGGAPLDFVTAGDLEDATNEFHFEEEPPVGQSSPHSFLGGFESDQSPLSQTSEGFHDGSDSISSSTPTSSTSSHFQSITPTASHHAPPAPLHLPTLMHSPSLLQAPSLQAPSLQNYFPQGAHIQVFCPGVQPELHFLSPHLPPKRRFSSPSPCLTPTTPTTTTTPTTERRKYSTYAIKTSSLEKLQPNLASLNLTKKELDKGSSQETSAESSAAAAPGKAPPSSGEVTSEVKSEPGPIKAEVQQLATPTADSEFGSSTRSGSPDGESRDDDGESLCDEDYDGESALEDDEFDEDGNYVPPLAPSTRVIEHKPKRGGRHRRDAFRREELLPPPSPHTQSDPGLMQVYRQERNRLAAKRSRERKKDYIKQLESTCKALKLHNEELSRELLKVRKEHSDLKSKPKKVRKSSLP